MIPRIIRDISLPELWKPEQLQDWVHPVHGPIPSKLFGVQTNVCNYKIAIWYMENYIITAVERVSGQPLGRGDILFTAKWAVDEVTGCLMCIHSGRHMLTPISKYKEEEDFNKDFLDVVIEDAQFSTLG